MGEVKTESVTLWNNDEYIVKDISLTAPDGRITVILGESGAGKTTILRIIAGLQKHDSGHVFIGGKCVDSVPPWKRGVGMIFQDAALFPHMTVRENIAFGLEARGWSSQDMKNRISELLELVGIKELAERYPCQLSGGEKQRVALARALAPNPEVLLLDEPLSNLDTPLRKKLAEELYSIQRELNATFIHVTHDLPEALSLADHMVILHKGIVLQEGSPLEIWRNPSSPAVAELMGMFPIYTEKDVVYYFHPADVIVADDGEIEGSVTGIRHQGEIVLLKLKTELGIVFAPVSPDNIPSRGSKISVIIKWKHGKRFHIEGTAAKNREKQSY